MRGAGLPWFAAPLAICFSASFTKSGTNRSSFLPFSGIVLSITLDYVLHGYMTAWFLYFLQGDEETKALMAEIRAEKARLETRPLAQHLANRAGEVEKNLHS